MAQKEIDLQYARLGDLFMTERGVLVSLVIKEQEVGHYICRCADYPADDECITYSADGSVIGAPSGGCLDMRMIYALVPRSEFEWMTIEGKLKSIMGMKHKNDNGEFSLDVYYDDNSRKFCGKVTKFITACDFDGETPPPSIYHFRSNSLSVVLDEIYNGLIFPQSIERVEIWSSHKG